MQCIAEQKRFMEVGSLEQRGRYLTFFLVFHCGAIYCRTVELFLAIVEQSTFGLVVWECFMTHETLNPDHERQFFHVIHGNKITPKDNSFLVKFWFSNCHFLKVS